MQKLLIKISFLVNMHNTTSVPSKSISVIHMKCNSTVLLVVLILLILSVLLFAKSNNNLKFVPQLVFTQNVNKEFSLANSSVIPTNVPMVLLLPVHVQY